MNTQNRTFTLKDLPKGWASATIGEIVGDDGVFSDGDWVESDDQDPNGDVRLVQLADIGDGYYRNRSNRFLTYSKAIELRCTFLQRDDVLIARMPEPLGRACVFPGDPKRSVTAVDVCIVRTGSKGANHRWLMYTINSPDFRASIASLQTGTTRKRISRSNLSKLHLPLPPLPEQQRIAAKIEELFTKLDAGVEALKKVKAQLKKYRQAVLKAAVTGELTKEWREAHKGELEPASELLKRIFEERRAKWEAEQLAKMKTKGKIPKNDEWKKNYKDPDPPDIDQLPELPQEWLWTTLGTVSDIQLGKMLSPKAYAKGLIQLPYLRNTNIRWGKIDFSDLKKMGFDGREQAKYKLECGDLIVCEGGEAGRCAVFKDAPTKVMYQKALHRVRFYGRFVNPHFIQYCFEHFVTSKTVIPRISETTIQHLPQEKMITVPIPLAPQIEQSMINDQVQLHFSIIDELDSIIKENLIRANLLRQSILKRAFEGKLVPQDPSDELAEKLLERIKTEKAKRQGESKGRKKVTGGRAPKQMELI